MAVSSNDQASRLKKLYELSMALSGDPMDIFVKAARIIAEIMEVKVVCLSEIRGQDLHFLSVYADGKVQTNAGYFPLEITPCATVEESKDIRVYANVSELFPNAAFLKEHNVYSYCGFPSLGCTGNVVAVTCLLDDRPHAFSAEDQELLRIFGQRIGLEIERKHLQDSRNATLAALEYSEQRFRDITKATGELVWEIDIDGRINYLSDLSFELVGYPASYLLGKNIVDILCVEQDFTDFTQSMWAQCPADGLEYQVRLRNGTPLWLRVKSLPIRDRQGQTLGYRGTACDITNAKRVEENLITERNRLRRILDSLSVFIALLDSDGNVIEANRTPWAAAGIRREDYIGIRFGESRAWTYDPAVYERVRLAVLQAQQGDTVRYDVPILMANGLVDIDFTLMPLFDEQGRIDQIVACGVDISIRKKALEALRQQQEALYYAQRLTAAGELTAIVAHELNQPLGAINNYIGGALLRFRGLLTEHPSLADVLEQTLRLSQRAMAVIHGIRALVRKQEGKPDWVSLASVVDEVLIPLRTEISNKQIKLSIDIPLALPPLWCEKIHLQQLLLNLILNAIQAMDTVECSQRKLMLCAKLNANNTLELTVSDSGSGIAPEIAERLFEPFLSTKAEGIGLGLSICRTITEAYGGRISAQSIPRQGTAFDVVLPLGTQRGNT